MNWDAISAVATTVASIIALSIPFITNHIDKVKMRKQMITDIETLIIDIIIVYDKEHKWSASDELCMLLQQKVYTLYYYIFQIKKYGIYDYSELLALIKNILNQNRYDDSVFMDFREYCILHFDIVANMLLSDEV